MFSDGIPDKHGQDSFVVTAGVSLVDQEGMGCSQCCHVSLKGRQLLLQACNHCCIGCLAACIGSVPKLNLVIVKQDRFKFCFRNLNNTLAETDDHKLKNFFS